MSGIDYTALYIRKKFKDYIDGQNPEYEVYLDYYADIELKELRHMFALFHYQLNHYFDYMNYRLSYRHYTADESRALIYWIDEVTAFKNKLAKTQYEFSVLEDYHKMMLLCLTFLQTSRGSTIPEDFKRIDIEDMRPLFTINSNVTISSEFGERVFQKQLIGEGSYAKVFKYKDTYYDKNFVIKRAKDDLREDEYQRFITEYEEMKKLNSPYIVEVYNFDKTNRQYTMEFLDSTLRDYIKKNNTKLKSAERVGLVRQILKAFSYISSTGKLHRDISPTNILIKNYEDIPVVKVSDFGLVKLEDSQLTKMSTDVKGVFNDPKLQTYGFKNYDIRHETYAISRIIYFVMTGKDSHDYGKNKLLEAFIEKGISDDIKERYQSMDELTKAFNAYAAKLE